MQETHNINLAVSYDNAILVCCFQRTNKSINIQAHGVMSVVENRARYMIGKVQKGNTTVKVREHCVYCFYSLRTSMSHVSQHEVSQRGGGVSFIMLYNCDAIFNIKSLP